MNDRERQLVKSAFSRQAEQVRAAQRVAEVLANLFEEIRPLIATHPLSGVVWRVLSSLQDLERIPLRPIPVDPTQWPPDDSFRWYFMERALPVVDLFRQGRDLEELTDLLYRQADEPETAGGQEMLKL